MVDTGLAGTIRGAMTAQLNPATLAELVAVEPARTGSRDLNPADAARTVFMGKLADLFMREIQSGATVTLALDALLDSAELRGAASDLHEHVQPQPWKRTKAETRFQSAVFLDTKLGTRIRRAVKLANETSKSVAGGERDIPTTVPEDEQRRNPLWFFDDPSLPETFVRGLLAARRGELAHTLVHWMTVPLIRNLELARELARVWVQEMETYAVFVASSPGAKVPESIVAKDKRRDIGAERERRTAVLGELAKV